MEKEVEILEGKSKRTEIAYDELTRRMERVGERINKNRR